MRGNCEKYINNIYIPKLQQYGCNSELDLNKI